MTRVQGRNDTPRRTWGRRARLGDRGAATGLAVGGAAVVAAALVGGGVWAATQLSGGGAQPDDVLPDSTLGYVRVDLDPSATQKVDLMQLLRRFPDFERATGISSDREDVRRLLVQGALDEAACAASYDDDVEPWIGDRAAVAAMPGADGAQPQPFAVLQVRDASAAEDGLDALSQCLPGAGYAFTGDYAVLAQTQLVADTVVERGESAPLSGDEAYAEDMDRLGDPGLASFWVDVPAVSEQIGSAAAQLGGLDLMSGGPAQSTSLYGTFRAGEDNLELRVLSSGTQVLDNGASPIGELPESTLVALSASGLGDAVPSMWKQLRETADGVEPGSFDRQVAELEAETGLRLPEDLATLLGDNVTVGVDGKGLDPESLAGRQPRPSDVGVGVRLTGDTNAIRNVVERIQASLDAQRAPFDLATLEVEGGLVVASNDAYATAMDDGGLSGSDTFEGAVGDPDGAAAVSFVDLDRLTEMVRGLVPPSGSGGPAEIVGTFEPLRALGARVSIGDGYSEAVIRLTFD